MQHVKQLEALAKRSAAVGGHRRREIIHREIIHRECAGVSGVIVECVGVPGVAADVIIDTILMYIILNVILHELAQRVLPDRSREVRVQLDLGQPREERAVGGAPPGGERGRPPQPARRVAASPPESGAPHEQRGQREARQRRAERRDERFFFRGDEYTNTLTYGGYCKTMAINTVIPPLI